MFTATIVALVAQPMPMGASVMVAMTLLALTGTLPPAKVLTGFANITVWLIFVAFLFGRAFTVTGLGRRVGYLFIRRFARSPLSLGYSLAAADLVLAPFIPSDTARGGSIVFPVTRSVASALGSEPGPTAGRIGSYLVLASFHTCYTASAMFLTGMAANPLIADVRPADRPRAAYLDALVRGRLGSRLPHPGHGAVAARPAGEAGASATSPPRANWRAPNSARWARCAARRSGWWPFCWR